MSVTFYFLKDSVLGQTDLPLANYVFRCLARYVCYILFSERLGTGTD